MSRMEKNQKVIEIKGISDKVQQQISKRVKVKGIIRIPLQNRMELECISVVALPWKKMQ